MDGKKRPISQSQEFFFGGQVLSCDDFWKCLQVPYDLLLESLAIAGQGLKTRIRAAVRDATPRSIRKQDPDRKIAD